MTTVLGTACADFSRGSGVPDGAGGDTVGDAGAEAGATSFADVHGILVDGCRSCHAPGQQAGDSQFLLSGNVATDFVAVTPFVNTAAPTGSRLLTKMTGQGHTAGTIYAPDSTAYQMVLRWIQEGARP